MTEKEIAVARADIETTEDLLERAMKIAGLVTALFRERGVSLVVVGGSAVEFYTEGGYMSGDIDFCRRSLKGLSLRETAEVLAPLGASGMGRNWRVCGIFVDFLGIAEMESAKDWRTLETPYGDVRIIPAELALVERILFAEQNGECLASARQMMAAALKDPSFDWAEAERLASLPDFAVRGQMDRMKRELTA